MSAFSSMEEGLRRSLMRFIATKPLTSLNYSDCVRNRLKLSPLPIQSMKEFHRPHIQIFTGNRGISDIVEASNPSAKKLPSTGSADANNGRGDESFYSLTETTFLSVLTLLLAYTTWVNWDKLKRKATDCFRVEAAKPIGEHDESYASLGSQGNSSYRFGGGGGGGDGDGDGNDGKPKSRRQSNNEIADVVEKVGASVVGIEIKDHSTLDWMSGVPRTASNGSGFIIKEDGLILTNAHVVMGRHRSSLHVRLHDGRRFAASVEDVDTQSDIATIRIHARGLPVMPLGSSSGTRIGEKVVAIGSPLSLSNTVTSGVVSCVSRKAGELGIGTNINYIQTDAAITFGNSGGPLVNLDGEAIGINSMKVTAGISFAIPIDYVKEFLAKAEASAKAAGGKKIKTKRYIGFTLLTMSEDVLSELPDFGWARDLKGVLVWKVVVGSPAYMAGLQPGDVITKINGETVTTAGEIFKLLQTADTFTIQFRRYDKTYRCQLVPESINQ